MKEIKILTALIDAVAQRAGVSPEEYIAKSRSISSGRKVCAHFKRKVGKYSFFVCA